MLAKHIFKNDVTQSALYAANPARFVTSVETHLRRYGSVSYTAYKTFIVYLRLKAEYSKYVKEIGATGAGLDPEEVTPGSELANLIGKSSII